MGRPSDPKTVLLRYEEAQRIRAPYETDWRMAAAYVLPRTHSAWQANGPPGLNPRQAAVRYAFDSTGVNALPKYVAILQRLATPMGHRWHKLRATNTELMKKRSVRLYFEEVTKLLFDKRAESRARFEQASLSLYTSIGVYGTAPKFIGKRKRTPLDRVQGPLYKSCALRDIFVLLDDEGHIDTVFRRFWLTARTFKQKWPEAAVPRCIANELAKQTGPSETEYFEFVHVVHPRTDYDPESLSSKRHPFTSYYLAVKDAEYVGDEEGYQTMPYLIPRVSAESDEPYGYSPAMQAMPALGTVNAMKKTTLKQGQKAVDPVILTADDGVLNGRVDMRPGAANPGGISKDGKKLIDILPTGNFNVAENLIADERKDINDAFFVTLFQILTETPEMTATEVIERVAEKASLLAPTMAWLQAEYLGPMIEREISMYAEWGLLPPMPPELIEAAGSYSITYTSPMAKGLHAEETSGFFRMVEQSIAIASATGDPSSLDHYDFDTAIPEIADQQAVPARWMRDIEAVNAIRDGRQQQAETEQMIKAAPAMASVATAAMKGGAK